MRSEDDNLAGTRVQRLRSLVRTSERFFLNVGIIISHTVTAPLEVEYCGFVVHDKTCLFQLVDNYSISTFLQLFVVGCLLDQIGRNTGLQGTIGSERVSLAVAWSGSRPRSLSGAATPRSASTPLSGAARPRSSPWLFWCLEYRFYRPCR